jgi:hypothetical protein
MAIDDNVVKFPAALERRAQSIKAAMTRRDSGAREWIEGTLELAIEIAAARAEFKGDQDFGSWLVENGLGENHLPKNDRAILIQWGRNQEWTRTVLEKTERRSIQTIHRNEWVLTSVSKPSIKPPGGAKLHAAKAFAQAYEAETGRLPTERLTARETGVSQGVSADALRDLKSRRAEEDGPIRFLKAQDHHVEARIKIRARELEADFAERVRLATLEKNAEYLAGLERLERQAAEKLELYETMVNRHQPIFTEAEFNDILFCTHWDQRNALTEERANRAVIALTIKKQQLTGKK